MKTTSGVIAVLAGLVLLTASVACSEPGDCAGVAKDLPITVWIDDRFNDVERAAIVSAMNVWDRETMAGRQNKSPLFIYAGLVSDKELNEDAAYDGKSITYNIVSKDEKEYLAEGAKDLKHEPLGVCVGGDVGLALFKYSTEDRANPEYEHIVEMLAIHELGHLLGLPDVNDRDRVAAMWSVEVWIVDENGEPTVTEYDIELFCALYPCN